MFNERKVTDMAVYLLQKSTGHLYHLKLMKLLYLAERLSYEVTGRPMVDDKLVSMNKGPVLSRTLDLMQGSVAPDNYWNTHIEAISDYRVMWRDSQPYESKELNATDKSILDTVWQMFGGMSRWALCDWTHEHCLEWQDPKGSSIPISKDDLLAGVKERSLLPDIPFNYDLERMKDRVENQDFVEVPSSALESNEAFRAWLETA